MSVYEVANLETLLSANPYPGRGIVLGQTPDGTRMVVAYFIMGRSPNSRNRVFERTEDGIRTRAYDPSKVEDPSLIIYNPLRTVDGALIVTNGVTGWRVAPRSPRWVVFWSPVRTANQALRR